MADSRRWPRIPLALTVRMRFSDLDEVVQGHTANVSREGLFIRMDKPRPIGTSVHVELEIVDTGAKVAIDGVVVRCIPDPDDPQPRPKGEINGIAVFVTGASEGWEHLCDALAKHKGEKAPAPRSPVEAADMPVVQFDSPAREPK